MNNRFNTKQNPKDRPQYYVLYTPYISRGFYFREFRESGAIREFINTRKYLPPIPTHECDLCTQYIALLDREFNHSRKCLRVPIREKLDSQNIWRIQYSVLSPQKVLHLVFYLLHFLGMSSKERFPSNTWPVCVLVHTFPVFTMLGTKAPSKAQLNLVCTSI